MNFNLFFRLNVVYFIKLFSQICDLNKLIIYKMPSISSKGNAMPQSPIRKLVPFAEAAKKMVQKFTI